MFIAISLVVLWEAVKLTVTKESCIHLLVRCPQPDFRDTSVLA